MKYQFMIQEIADACRQQRLVRELSLEEVAKRAKVHKNTVYLLEKSRTRRIPGGEKIKDINLGTLDAICGALGLKLKVTI